VKRSVLAGLVAAPAVRAPEVDIPHSSSRHVVRHLGGFVASFTVGALTLGSVLMGGVAPMNQDGTNQALAVTTINAENTAATPRYHTGVQIIGRSVKGRAITLTIVGSPTAKKRVMVVGEIHGNERGGVPVARAIAKSKAPRGMAYFVVSYPNPDGAALNTRGNARRVDLNRNFPGWKRNGKPGSVYYPGPGSLSEPESKAMYTAINKIKPTAFVTYHQHMNLIDFCGGLKTVGATYAKQTGMKYTQLPSYPGSQATWLHKVYPHTTVITVELPSRVSTAMVNRHIAAVKYLAWHH
jgi:protein MpaA